MNNQINTTDTIAAIATPAGRGGVGIVRLSGPSASLIGEKVVKKPLKPKKIAFLPFYNQSNEMIDHGVVLCFKAPHSFTGEDVVELQAHGSPVVLAELLKLVNQLGARLARPGEFSERAFLNNKMDLTQAEAIADLINASSIEAARSAVLSMEGKFSSQIKKIVNKLIELRAYIESSLDFSDEEIDFLDKKNIRNRLEALIEELSELIDSTRSGVLLQEGIRVVIAGRPNAGKSSLLNRLTGKEAAIVANLAGTTRDVLREYIHIDGIPLHIIDTAGLHQSDHDIEKEAIKRTSKEIEKADHILLIDDMTRSQTINPEEILADFYKTVPHDVPVTIVKNKIDLLNQKPRIDKNKPSTVIYLSAKLNQGVDLLKKHLEQIAGFDLHEEGVFMARRRHLEALQGAKSSLIKGVDLLNKEEDLLAEELRFAQNRLNSITGEFTLEDLLTTIFSQFCIGK